MTIFILLFSFIFLRKYFRFIRSKKNSKNNQTTMLNKSKLNKWMNLTKKERYNLSKKDSASYLNKRKVLLNEIRKEYEKISKNDPKKT